MRDDIEDVGDDGAWDDPLRLRLQLAARLRELRQQSRLSQRALGPRLGFSRQMIWAWEHGVAPIEPPIAIRWIEICQRVIAERAEADATVARLLGVRSPRRTSDANSLDNP